MSLDLTTDTVLLLIGKRVNDNGSNYLGDVVEIIRNPINDAIDYIVLKSNKLLDQEDRFFALPVSSSVIKITETGEITLLADEEELHLACGTTLEKCPQPNHHLDPLIYEIYEYNEPEYMKRKK